MAQIRILGDIHGNFSKYRENLEGCEHSIQLGDFGIGFNDEWDTKIHHWMIDNSQHRFIRGNHDDPAKCKRTYGYISDGAVRNNMMCIGGAWSIDREWRTEGIDWWPDEELSYDELQHIIDVYSIMKPSIVLSHDGPTNVTENMFIKSGLSMFPGTPIIKTRTGQALQTMFEIHQPKLWMFGHWHKTIHNINSGTEFICVGEHDYVDIELNDY